MSALQERFRRLTPEERDIMARTIVGEAANQGEIGKRAVAAVIGNRMLGADQDAASIVLARRQFEPWGNAAARARIEALTPQTPSYQRAMAQIDALAQGAPDPTNGATHFYAPRAQAQLGRRPPSWDDGTGVDIRDHRFFRLGYGGSGPGNPHGIAPGQQAIDRQMAGGLRPASDIPNLPITSGPSDLARMGPRQVGFTQAETSPALAYAGEPAPAPAPAGGWSPSQGWQPTQAPASPADQDEAGRQRRATGAPMAASPGASPSFTAPIPEPRPNIPQYDDRTLAMLSRDPSTMAPGDAMAFQAAMQSRPQTFDLAQFLPNANDNPLARVFSNLFAPGN